MSRDLRDRAWQELASREVSSENLGEVRRRARRIRTRQHAWAVGAVAAVIVGATLVVPELDLGREGRRVAARVQREDVPEGTLLMQFGHQSRVLEPGRQSVVGQMQSYDLSSSATHVLGTNEVWGQDGIGARDVELVLTDVETGEENVLARSGSDASFGQAAFSPDGSKVAYLFASWRPDAAVAAPEARQSLCLARVDGSNARCLRNLGHITWFSWSPTGGEIVAAGLGEDPVYVVNVNTERARVLLPSGGNDSVREGLRAAGYGTVQQFVGPVWSADAGYVAVAASVTPGGSVPVVVEAVDGEFVAIGKSNPDLQQIAWSPLRNELAYTTGFNGVGPEDLMFGVHLLDATTGDDRLLHSTKESSYPFIFKLAWSPSGRWIALDHATTIEFVDATLEATAYEVELETDDPQGVSSTLRDWEA